VFHQDPNELSTRGGQDAKGKYEELDVLCYGYTTYIGNINNLPNVLREQKDGREGGLYYQKYWKKAFDTRPKVVLIWAYNHWDVNFNKPDAKGMVSWHDNFNTNYSGGLEPIKNDFVYRGTSYPGDSYYVWTKQYIEAYKNNKDMPMDLFVKGSY
ncbi:MAG: hypothetical protein LBI03_08230, partial [Clostridiales bacterium]|nr:hypothetical protein [Clostridiales bacterium]